MINFGLKTKTRIKINVKREIKFEKSGLDEQ